MQARPAVWRVQDLLSAWWLPIALLLPPLYALLAPLLVGAVLYQRALRIPVYRRVFSSAALSLAGAATSATFHLIVPDAIVADPDGNARAWLTRPSVVLTAIACAVVFAAVNLFIVAVAAYLAEPEGSVKNGNNENVNNKNVNNKNVKNKNVTKMLWDRETLLLDLTGTCVGILVAATCALSYLLLLVALPPVVLLQRSLMHQQPAAAARTDQKTGLLNATAWQREADAEVVRARRANSPLALLLVDVDHFKRVNDNHGHLIGDEVLRALAAELRHQVRESDVVGRFGGEEFTVLLPRTDDADAHRIAERLRASAARLSVATDPKTAARITVTVSIGAAVLGQHGRDLFELLAAADVTLYQAKGAGRDQVRMYAHAAGRATTSRATTSQHADEATDPYP